MIVTFARRVEGEDRVAERDRGVLVDHHFVGELPTLEVVLGD
ncbi:MAG TPA: hypothetical protein VMT85_12605 [Thermoanaerobaculia bacterium]|nr:hypothetical protein [Thermoanaerobaculia bacterium]